MLGHDVSKIHILSKRIICFPTISELSTFMAKKNESLSAVVFSFMPNCSGLKLKSMMLVRKQTPETYVAQDSDPVKRAP